jgi:hypothetical protein
MYIILLHNFNFEVCIIVEETNYTPFLGGGVLLGCFAVADGDGIESCIKLDWL